MISNALPTSQAGVAFDTLADDYDAHFTQSHIGRAQRDVVWREAEAVFGAPLSILELNCGTGEDALFLAARGHRVTALDASRAMIERATSRRDLEAPNSAIDFRILPTEHLSSLPPQTFDAVFSNFSGLNCVDDLTIVATQLGERTLPGAPLLFCISTRFCLWEFVWYLLRANPRKATRRWPGHSTATLNGISVTVHYPTITAFAKAFAPHFTLQNFTGIGIFVPPSYVEPWIRHRPRLLAMMCGLDRAICRLPLLRALGDHVLLHFVRTPEAAR
jgi:SAM-dependent methyltransferase